MKSVMSFVLWGTEERYWGSIAFNAIAYSLMHPEQTMRVHVHKDAAAGPLFPILDELSKHAGYEIKVIDRAYEQTEPTTWRMMPLWDGDVDYLFCRDMDMVPMTAEVRAVEMFRNLGVLIHSIRSYSLHTTTLMAGMCGFNCQAVRNTLDIGDNWDFYHTWGHDNIEYCSDWRWGCDQFLLDRFFFGQNSWLAGHTLDTMLYNARPIAEWNPIHKEPEEYSRINVDHINPRIREICDNLVTFLGQPFITEPEHLTEALKIDCDMSRLIKDIFNRHQYVKDYYRAEY